MPSRDKPNESLLRILDKSDFEIQKAIKEAEKKIADLSALMALRGGASTAKVFNLLDYPEIEKAMRKVYSGMVLKISVIIERAEKQAWLQAAGNNDKLVEDIVKKIQVPQEIIGKWNNRNLEALAAFQKRKIKGLGLSERIWLLADHHKAEMEQAIDLALGEGKSAAELSRDIRHLLKEPNNLYRRVRDKNGNLRPSAPMLAKKTGAGVYKSSYKNAMRMSRTEITMAYRNSDMLRYQQLDFVVGYKVNLSNRHLIIDICDDLKGEYPKTFRFHSWHPQCYSDDTEVLTNKGWKYFRDVVTSDQIFSLSPKTKQTEWTGVKSMIQYIYKGPMIRFANKSLDLFVTPDHRMVYLNKGNNQIQIDKQAAIFTQNHGILYRSSQTTAPDKDRIVIGDHIVNFDVFCEFMAYYLSEGSLAWTRNYQLFIAKSRDKKPEMYKRIADLLDKMPFTARPGINGFYINDQSFYEYLKQFGKSPQKHVPREIKEASKRQILIFLDSYVLCDGTTRPNKEFIGNRGGKCSSKKNERIFFTISNQMAADLGELLVIAGRRPSYKIQKAKDIPKKHRNGIYSGNYDCWRISECHSETATVFNKSIENYSGMVYDLELEKNHILYVRRNGRCVWGSNCLCFTTSILMTEEELSEMEDRMLEGRPLSGINSVNQINDVPKGFKDWINKNRDRLNTKPTENQPWFIKDNFKGGRIEGGLKIGIPTGNPIITGNIIKQPIPDKVDTKDLLNKFSDEELIQIANDIYEDDYSFYEQELGRSLSLLNTGDKAQRRERIINTIASFYDKAEPIKNIDGYLSINTPYFRHLNRSAKIAKHEKELLYERYINNESSYDINAFLRKFDVGDKAVKDTWSEKISQIRGVFVDNEALKAIDVLDRIIAQNILENDIVLFRYIQPDAIESLIGENITMKGTYDAAKILKKHIGGVVQDKGFWSTSAIEKKNVVRNFPIQLEIHAPKGTNAYVTDNIMESEIILKRGTKCVIKDMKIEERPLFIFGASDKFIKIILEII